ncbi:CRP-like cAMP-binding protein [Rhodopseudomonas rhenobacensis]|uniref:CRP-like cAMP-binding protein n=1 Tax=Rhodopseudomonas rhenobacensis TaxID=87461 RepID=A0A7W7Z8B4_9BRAD|nr:Crp/Fnr family transcriptional regulator [Rhodopseudomonas rhenobacensis]MBB5049886.1 CRP-like cAMP-binding protein [Rhodopseudomonas rhenobacensis]
MALYRRPPNQLLASLPQPAFDVLRPELRTVALALGEVLIESGRLLTRVYFPHSGIISSIVNLADGETIEVAMVGRCGVFGASAVLNGGSSPTGAVVEFAGTASVIDAKPFLLAVAASEPLRALLMQQQWGELVRTEQFAACNASHDLAARICRRLARMRDLALSDSLPLTQEVLARLLGVRRNSVSLVAGALQEAGVIRYTRGRIDIVDPAGLMARACECYWTNKAQGRMSGGAPPPAERRCVISSAPRRP